MTISAPKTEGDKIFWLNCDIIPDIVYGKSSNNMELPVTNVSDLPKILRSRGEIGTRTSQKLWKTIHFSVIQYNNAPVTKSYYVVRHSEKWSRKTNQKRTTKKEPKNASLAIRKRFRSYRPRINVNGACSARNRHRCLNSNQSKGSPCTTGHLQRIKEDFGRLTGKGHNRAHLLKLVVPDCPSEKEEWLAKTLRRLSQA